MEDEDALFESIRALSDAADDLGLSDVSLVLEFALDVYLKETDSRAGKAPVPTAMKALESSAERLKLRSEDRVDTIPRLGWSMSTFPLAQVQRKAS